MHLVSTISFLLIMASAVAAAGIPDVTVNVDLEQQWVIRDSEGAGFLFGIIEDIVIDDSNTVYALDAQLDEIKVYSETGIHLRTIGRSGDGPGELRAPRTLVLLPDNTIGVVSKMVGKITVIDRDSGDPRGVIRCFDTSAPHFLHRVHYLYQDTDNWYLAADVSHGGHSGFFARNITVSILSAPVEDFQGYISADCRKVGYCEDKDVEEEEFYTLWEPWTVSPSGLIALAPYWREYILEYYNAEGNKVESIQRVFSHRDRSENDKKRFVQAGWGGASPEQLGLTLEYSDVEAVIRYVYAPGMDSLWIETNRSGFHLSPGVYKELDVIGLEGRLEKHDRLRLWGDGDPELDRMFVGRDGFIVIAHEFEHFIQTSRGRATPEKPYDFRIAGYRMKSREHQ